MEKSREILKLREYFTCGILAHAYLISTNDIDTCFDELINVIKGTFFLSNTDDNSNISNLIDKNVFPCLQIIEPDGNCIKKEQIKNLKILFSTKSQFSDYNIYIIKNAEKMNKEATNSFLKFIEEPNENVIGFFITNEKGNILDTIISRCENLIINYDLKLKKFTNEIDNKLYDSYLNVIHDYLFSLESCINDSILLNRNKILLTYSNKDDIINLFKIILNIYYAAFQNQEEFLCKYKIFDFISFQDKKCLQDKIDLISDILYRLNYNINVELVLDKFVIEVNRINELYIRSNV